MQNMLAQVELTLATFLVQTTQLILATTVPVLTP